MESLKFSAYISSNWNLQKKFSWPKKHLLESVIASISGASIPAIVFYFLIWLEKKYYPKLRNNFCLKKYVLAEFKKKLGCVFNGIRPIYVYSMCFAPVFSPTHIDNKWDRQHASSFHFFTYQWLNFFFLMNRTFKKQFIVNLQNHLWT